MINTAKIYALIIREMPRGDGGIQGFKEIDFYIDKFGEIANSFLEITPSSKELVIEKDVRKIQVEPQYIKYVYINKSNS